MHTGDDLYGTAVDMREYIAVIRRRKWSIILVALLAVAVAIGLTLRQTPVYSSVARVLVLPTAPASSPFFFLAEINMDTEAGLVDSESVASLVKEQLALGDDVDSLVENLDVSVEGATEILSIQYTSTDPARAQTLARAFATAYLEFRQAQAQEQITTQVVAVNQQIRKVSDKIASLEATIDATTDPTEAARLRSEVEAQQARLSVLEQDLASLGGGSLVQPGGSVVQAPDLPRTPSNENFVTTTAVAVLVGLSLGTGIAFARERLDDSLRGRDDFEVHLGSPVLAVIPRIRSWRNRNRVRLITSEEPRSAAAEAYKALRTSMLFAASRSNLQVIMVTSPAAGDGKTSTAANLAVSLSQTGRRVIVVSADLRRPRIHRFFGVEDELGLVDVLDGDVPLEAALVPTEIENLRVLPVGPSPGNPAELLQSDAMRHIVARLRTASDFVIIDSAPILAVADSLALCPSVDGVLFVIDAGHGQRRAVAAARAELARVDGRIIGGVYNNVDSRRSSGKYEYRYYYRYDRRRDRDGKGRRGRRRERDLDRV